MIMIYKTKNIWYRICPKCNNPLAYKSGRSNAVFAEKNNSQCFHCAKKGHSTLSEKSKNKLREKMKEYWDNKRNGIIITQYMDGKVYYNERGMWCRRCPSCSYELEYGRKDGAIFAEKNKSICQHCVRIKKTKNHNIIRKMTSKRLKNYQIDGIHLNKNKMWCRMCPKCNEEIEYTSRYWSIKASQNNTECTDCIYKRYQSKVELDFLNHMQIQDRQITVGTDVVDGIKDNIVYEFLGDYWHGNPKIYDLNDINKVKRKPFRELYNETIERFNRIKNLGYEVKYIWESDWVQFKRDNLLDSSKLKYFNNVDI